MLVLVRVIVIEKEAFTYLIMNTRIIDYDYAHEHENSKYEVKLPPERQEY